MQDPDEWNVVGVHWHAYVEVRDGREQFGSARTDRLRRNPATVLRTPEEVADWIADMTSRHVPAKPIRLIGPGGGIGHVGDQGHVEHDLAHNLDALCRGNSLYTDFPREHDRLHLWAEAVTAAECTVAHGDRE
jgi:hypothetical protein